MLTAGYFAVCYFEYIFFFWLYYYFGNVRRFSQSQTTLATTALFVAWSVMTPAGGWCADRLTPCLGSMRAKRWVCTCTLPISPILLLAGASIESAIPSITCIALAMGFAAASDGPFWAAVIEASPGQVGAATSLLNTGGNLGGVVSPMLTPWVAAWAGWAGGLYLASAVVLIRVLLWFFVDCTPLPQPVPDPDPA